jgi:hypothetical protein
LYNATLTDRHVSRFQLSAAFFHDQTEKQTPSVHLLKKEYFAPKYETIMMFGHERRSINGGEVGSFIDWNACQVFLLEYIKESRPRTTKGKLER